MVKTSKLDSALAYASWGWKVLPVIPNGKIPATAHGVKDATTNEAQIRAWWNANPDYNIGVAAGRESGILVFDIDPRNGGDDSWEKWIGEYGNLPDAAQQLTAGGGQHFIAHYDESVRSCKLRDGIDLLSDGRYFLASPSEINGKTYEWEASSDPFDGIAPVVIPEQWLAGLAVRKVVESAERNASLITGNRNAGLTAIAGSMRHYGLSEDAIFAALEVINETRCEIPLPLSEVRQIAHSISNYTPEHDLAADIAMGSDAADLLLSVKRNTHPLNQFIDYDLNNIPPTEFVLDGIIAAGVVLIAGSAGAGKTTQLVPLMTRVAHLCDANDSLKPLLRRKIIYISEDAHQVLKIMRSMRESNELGGANAREVADWFKVVNAARLSPATVAQVAEMYESLSFDNINAETGQVYKANPVVVIDTLNATVDLENESDNSEVGKAMAVLKQRFKGIPIIAVGHIAKSLKRADVADFSARGAGAWEADANQVLYLTKEDDGKRWLEVAESKHRFVAKVDGIMFDSCRNNINSFDVLGNEINEIIIHGVPELIDAGGKNEIKMQAQEDKKRGDNAVFDIQKRECEKIIINQLCILPEGEYRTKNELFAMLESARIGKVKAMALIDNMVANGQIEHFTSPFPNNIKPRHKTHMSGYKMAKKYFDEA
jgi:hypothetical protein